MIKPSLILSILTVLFVLAGCERRPLEDRETDMADVLVEFDWSKSSLDPTEATVIFYDENGNSPRTQYIIGDRGIVKLPVGKYSVIAFNDKIGDFSQFGFRGTAYYKTIEVFATEMSRPSTFYGGSMDQLNDEYFDVLAADSKDLFEVTQAMLDQTRADRAVGHKAPARDKVDLLLTPIDVVAGTKLTVHFKNMHLIRTGSQRAKLTGFAESVTLWDRKTSGVCMTHTIPLSYAEYYNESETDGFMREQFSTFGLCTPPMGKSQPVTFLFEAILRDKEQTKFSVQKDITKFVEIAVDNSLRINIELGNKIDDDNPPIVIPPVDPIDNSAFKPGVDGWEEEEVIKPL